MATTQSKTQAPAKASEIKNHLQWIVSGDAPVVKYEDGTGFHFKEVVTTSSRGQTLHWRISVTLLGADGKSMLIEDKMLDRPSYTFTPGVTTVITTKSWINGGNAKAGVVPTVIAAGKNLGKKNATNCLTQALGDAFSDYNKKIKRSGDVSMPLPMLVAKFEETKADTVTAEEYAAGTVAVQPKFDGTRCVATFRAAPKGDIEIIAYSRGYTILFLPEAIIAELKTLFNAAIAAKLDKVTAAGGLFIDGELFSQGHALNEISGAVRDSSSEKKIPLAYHIFDCFVPDAPTLTGAERQSYIAKLFTDDAAKKPREFKTLIHVETHAVKTRDEVLDWMKKFLAAGYEGAIIRRLDRAYQYSRNNYHSHNVLKLKPRPDAEFPVVGFEAGAGKDADALILECEVPSAAGSAPVRFTVVPNLTYQKRKEYYLCLSKNPKLFDMYVKGKPLTVEYSIIAKDTGKPQQPHATGFRERGADADPFELLEKACSLK